MGMTNVNIKKIKKTDKSNTLTGVIGLVVILYSLLIIWYNSTPKEYTIHVAFALMLLGGILVSSAITWRMARTLTTIPDEKSD